MGRCIVPGCGDDAVNRLALRLCKPGLRGAVWAPDLDACLCKLHAEEGGEFVIEFRPAAAKGRVGIEVLAGGQPVAHRTFAVRNSAA